jgi:hypothetical protein
MSAPGHGERSRVWLEEQLQLLGNLRNANPRDPSFKLWRQNTLTVLQRIWPGEQARSERFRRIAFSPASPKSEFKVVREWYVRGCSEATDFLRALLTEVDAVGVPEPGGPATAPPMLATSREDDFPVLDLPASGAESGAAAGSDDLVLLDQGGTAAALAPEPATHESRDPAAPAPPRLRVEVRPAAAPDSRPEGAPPSLPVRNAQSRPAPVANPESLPVMPVMPAAPHAQAPAPVAPVAPEVVAPAPAKPAAARPPERRSGAADRRVSARTTKARRAPAKPKLKDMLGLPIGGPPPVTPAPEAAAPTAPPPSAVPPVPAAPPRETPAAPAEPVTAADATAEFMRNSPVLGLQGRPVVRASDSTQFLEPDAVALATLAGDVARYVPDESAREPLRVALFELATQVEQKSPEWSALRDLVASAMAHPELARRLMPLVLPWLGRAA